MSINLWEWMRVNDHAGWQVFRQNASAFNEESGEIAFSVLARDIASSGIRSDAKTVSRKFGLIKANRGEGSGGGAVR
jgi:Tfp pilus assembly protein PilW